MNLFRACPTQQVFPNARTEFGSRRRHDSLNGNKKGLPCFMLPDAYACIGFSCPRA